MSNTVKNCILVSAVALCSLILTGWIVTTSFFEADKEQFELIEDDSTSEMLPPPTEIISIKGERYYGSIETTFWKSLDRKVGPRALLEKVSDALACSLDLSREGKRGDTWWAEVKGHDVVAFEYRTRQRVWRGVRGITAETYRHFYAPNGDSLCGQFRKSPVRYEKITSGFSFNRYHPILQMMRPHLGIDYGAPAGTPVVALGDGKITEKGYTADGGNMIILKHPLGYETRYKHLKGFKSLLTIGSEVKLGQVIGYVGSTGLATGPHLHFEMLKNGRYVNPATLRISATPTIPEELKNTFLVLAKDIFYPDEKDT